MTVVQLIQNQSLIQAFKRYQKRYLAVGKKPEIKHFLPEIVYRTMRLEGEKFTKKQSQELFK